jgi:serine/threonine protein kinase
VNEFKILNNIGKGSFSKVKKVLRKWTDSETEGADIEKYFAMKMMHKPLLQKQRAVKYSESGEMEITNYLE